EYFQYMIDLLKEYGAPHIRVFGGGGGTIIPKEVKQMHDYGVSQIFTPEDGRKLGLQSMINIILETCDYPTPFDREKDVQKIIAGNDYALARYITAFERGDITEAELNSTFPIKSNKTIPVLGI